MTCNLKLWFYISINIAQCHLAKADPSPGLAKSANCYHLIDSRASPLLLVNTPTPLLSTSTKQGQSPIALQAFQPSYDINNSQPCPLCFTKISNSISIDIFINRHFPHCFKNIPTPTCFQYLHSQACPNSWTNFPNNFDISIYKTRPVPFA